MKRWIETKLKKNKKKKRTTRAGGYNRDHFIAAMKTAKEGFQSEKQLLGKNNNERMICALWQALQADQARYGGTRLYQTFMRIEVSPGGHDHSHHHVAYL